MRTTLTQRLLFCLAPLAALAFVAAVPSAAQAQYPRYYNNSPQYVQQPQPGRPYDGRNGQDYGLYTPDQQAVGPQFPQQQPVPQPTYQPIPRDSHRSYVFAGQCYGFEAEREMIDALEHLERAYYTLDEREVRLAHKHVRCAERLVESDCAEDELDDAEDHLDDWCARRGGRRELDLAAAHIQKALAAEQSCWCDHHRHHRHAEPRHRHEPPRVIVPARQSGLRWGIRFSF